MYIEPNTNIKLLQYNAVDNEYKNTIYFANRTAQYNYFINKVKYNLTNYTYQRVSNGVCRVSINAENLYDCNYMMFQNTAFGSRWFYAFITNVQYINNGMSKVEFEIDEFQTWFLDCTLRESFVVREHIASDTVGNNIVPEQIDLGEYVVNASQSSGKMTSLAIVIASTKNADGTYTRGSTYGGIYSGAKLNSFTGGVSASGYANNFIESVEETPDAIVGIAMIPEFLITNTLESPNVEKISISKRQSSVNGYTPKNKKLLTYPYNFLYVTNLSGSAGVFPYEYFGDSTCEFRLSGDYSLSPTVVCYPVNYKGVFYNYDEMLSISGFPICSYSIDTYKQWLAQNANILAFRTASSVVSSISGGNVIGASSSIAETINTGYISSIQPPQVQGSQANSGMCAMGLKDFYFMNKSINSQTARVIDDYFDMFGYATHRVKAPNINSRPYWNYVETRDCNIIGSVPSDALKTIKTAFNRGITFWKNGDNVGNYSLNNH